MSSKRRQKATPRGSGGPSNHISASGRAKINVSNVRTERSLAFGAFAEKRERLKILLAAAVLAALLGWLLSPAIHFGFIYDDHAQIENNHEIQSWSNLGRLLQEPLWARLGPERASPYYRPIFSVFLLTEYKLLGPNAGLWHMVSVGLHIAVALTLFLLLVLQTGRWLPAFGAAFLFGTSPLTAEVGNWISASDESLYTLLLLCALCGLFLTAQIANPVQARILGILSALVLGMALFTKETAVAGVVAAVFLELLVLRNGRKRLHELLVLAAVLALWFVARPSMHARDYRSLKEVGATQVYVASLGFKKLLWPAPISQFYDLWIDQHHSTGSLAVHGIALAVVGILLVAAALRSRTVAWAVLIVVLPTGMSLAGISIFRNYDLFHDRYLYLPLCGIAILIAEGVGKIEKHDWVRNSVMGLIGVVICVQIAAFRLASAQFRNDLDFFSQAVRVAPANIVALQLLADAELQSGNCGTALGHYERAEQLRPDMWKTPFYLGIGYLHCEQMGPASNAFRQAAQLIGAKPEEAALAWYELGRLLLTQGDLNGARVALNEAMRRDPASRKLRAFQSDLTLLENRQ